MVLNFDDLAGCSRTTKALQIGGMSGSGCIQALAYRLCDSLLGVSHRQRQLWSPKFWEPMDRRGIHQLTANNLQNRHKDDGGDPSPLRW